jgi:hypothetical protein
MKDLTQIKKRLIESIRDHQDKIISSNSNQNVGDHREDQEVRFNAANYFFISTGLSKLYPDLRESRIIAQFTTPWPKQSYCRVTDVSKQYSKKFSALTRSASVIIIFLMGHFVSMPSGVQDLFIHVANTGAIGYIVLLHLQLYQLFPILVILPACIIGIIIHFIIVSGKADAKLRLAKLFPIPSNRNHKVDIESEITSDKIDDKVHRTRRASLEIGLDVIDNLRNNTSMSSESNSNSVSSSNFIDDGDSDDNMEEEEEVDVDDTNDSCYDTNGSGDDDDVDDNHDYDDDDDHDHDSDDDDTCYNIDGSVDDTDDVVDENHDDDNHDVVVNSLSVEYSHIVLQNVDVVNDNIEYDGSSILDADISVDSMNSTFDYRLEESNTNDDFDVDDDDVRESAFDSVSDSCNLDIDATNNGDKSIETDESLQDFSIHSSVFESDNIDLQMNEFNRDHFIS